jgi:hypothetical protein
VPRVALVSPNRLVLLRDGFPESALDAGARVTAMPLKFQGESGGILAGSVGLTGVAQRP